MSTALPRGLAGLAVLLAAAACGGSTTPRVAGPLPARVLPQVLAGFTTSQEKSADKAFASAGVNSLTAKGTVLTLRRDGAVRGALQVGVLKPAYDTRKISVRRGVRSNIETGQYRWFKVGAQWVGVQELPELRLYLWFPPRGDLYEVLQLQPDVGEQRALLTEILRYQKGTT